MRSVEVCGFMVRWIMVKYRLLFFVEYMECGLFCIGVVIGIYRSWDEEALWIVWIAVYMDFGTRMVVWIGD